MAEQQNVQIVIDALERARGTIANVVKDLNGVSPAAQQASKHLDKTHQSLKETESAAKQLGEKLKEVGKVLVAAFTVEKIIELTKNALEATHETELLSQAVGTTADQLYRLQYVMSRSNIDAGKFTFAMRGLSKALVDAQVDGSKEQVMFEQMGIKTLDATGHVRNAVEVLYEMADAFKSYANTPEKAALATDMFSRAGLSMISFLNLGSDEIKRRMAESRGLTDEQIEAAEKFAKMQGKIQVLLTEFGLTIGTAVVPALSDMVNGFSKGVRSSDEWRNSLALVGDTARGLVSILVVVATMITDSVDRIASLSRAAGSLSTNWLFRAAMGPAFMLMGPGEGGEQGMGGAASKAFNELADMEDRSEKRFKNMVEASAKLLDSTHARTGELQHQTSEMSKQEGVGKKIAPLATDPRKAAAAELAKIDKERADAEKSYQESLLETQKLVITGAISKQDAFDRDNLAALALSEDLKSINSELETLAKTNPKLPELGGKLDQAIVQQQQAELKALTPALNDWSAQMKVAMQELRDQFTQTAQSIAQQCKNTIGTAFKGLSAGIGDMVADGKKFSQVWIDVGRQAVKSITQMVAEYVAGKLAMMAVDAFASKSAQSNNAATTATAIPAGIAQAGAEGGWVGVLIYIGVFAAALAAISALAGAVTGFATGGPVNGGIAGQDSVPALLMPGEFVIPKAAVDRFGAAHFEAYRRGQTPSIDGATAIPAPNRSGFFATGGSVAGPGLDLGSRDTNVSVAFVNSRSDLREWMATEGYKIFADAHARRGNTVKA